MLNLSQPDLSLNSYLFLFESMNHCVRFERKSFFAWTQVPFNLKSSAKRLTLSNKIDNSKLINDFLTKIFHWYSL